MCHQWLRGIMPITQQQGARPLVGHSNHPAWSHRAPPLWTINRSREHVAGHSRLTWPAPPWQSLWVTCPHHPVAQAGWAEAKAGRRISQTCLFWGRVASPVSAWASHAGATTPYGAHWGFLGEGPAPQPSWLQSWCLCGARHGSGNTAPNLFQGAAAGTVSEHPHPHPPRTEPPHAGCKQTAATTLKQSKPYLDAQATLWSMRPGGTHLSHSWGYPPHSNR